MNCVFLVPGSTFGLVANCGDPDSVEACGPATVAGACGPPGVAEGAWVSTSVPAGSECGETTGAWVEEVAATEDMMR